MEWNHVGSTLQRITNSTTLPHLNPPLTKGRTLAERNFGKNGEPTPTENPEASKKKSRKVYLAHDPIEFQ